MPHIPWNKPVKSGRAFVITIVVAVFVYLLCRFIIAQSNTISTIPVQLVTVRDSIQASGFIVRDEAIITRNSGMKYTLLVSNGEKVSKEENIAVMYSTDAGLNNYLDALENKRSSDMLGSIIKNNSGSSDISSVNTEIYNYLYRLAQDSSSGMSGSGEYKGDLESAILSREYILKKDNTFVTNETKCFKAYQQLLKDAGSGAYIQTKQSGYFSVTVDGYESLLDTEKCLAFTTQSFSALTQKAVTAPEEGTLIGKLITGFEWMYAALLPESDAAQLTKNNSYKLLLRGEEIDAQLVSVGEVYDGKVLCVFKSGDQISEIASMRTETTEIVLNEVTGYRIPKSAIRMQGDKTGVFCLEGMQCVFKPVEIIFERDNYYIVKADLTNNNGIYLNDQLIVNKRNLKDGMIIQ